MNRQLTLALNLDIEATFANYFAADNQHIIHILKDFTYNRLNENFIYIWGQKGTGRSHLLQACCHTAAENDFLAMYLNLSTEELTPDILLGLETMQLICIDDLHAVIGDNHWEEALFHFYNRVRDADVCLLVSADVPPKQLTCQLADLASRLTWGLVFQIVGLNDQQKLAALQFRAEQRGLKLAEDVGLFLLRNFPRDMSQLFDILERLDHASLAEQRRLTIPFIKQVLSK